MLSVDVFIFEAGIFLLLDVTLLLAAEVSQIHELLLLLLLLHEPMYPSVISVCAGIILLLDASLLLTADIPEIHQLLLQLHELKSLMPDGGPGSSALVLAFCTEKHLMQVSTGMTGGKCTCKYNIRMATSLPCSACHATY